MDVVTCIDRCREGHAAASHLETIGAVLTLLCKHNFDLPLLVVVSDLTSSRDRSHESTRKVSPPLSSCSLACPPIWSDNNSLESSLMCICIFISSELNLLCNLGAQSGIPSRYSPFFIICQQTTREQSHKTRMNT
jgi:hypothetical protein